MAPRLDLRIANDGCCVPMTAQLLAQAVAVAYNPKSSPEELWEVIGDLLSFGALDAADEALRKLRAEGKSISVVARLERTVTWFRNLGPQFGERRLAGAMALARQEDATNEQLIKAAESLIVWGLLDEADGTLARLREREYEAGPIARLSAASRQLRRSGILEELQSLTPRRSLNKPYEVLIRKKRGARSSSSRVSPSASGCR